VKMDKRNRVEQTLETIRAWTETNNYKLVRGHYVKESSIMTWQCLLCNGEEFDESWSYMRKNGIVRCKCRPSRKQINMYNDIVKWSLERDLVFLSERYIRHDSLLMWMCNRCGEDIKSDWNEISRARTTICLCRKPESKEVLKLRELNMTSGCKLITPFEDYRTVQDDLIWECPLHDRFKRQLNLINMYGFVCRECTGAQDTRKLTIERVREHCEYAGFSLNEDKPVVFQNNRSKVPVICLTCDYPDERRIASLSQGYSCMNCYKQLGIDQCIAKIKRFLELRRSKLMGITDFKDRFSKVIAVCQNNHEFHPSLSSLTHGNWCKYCVPHKFTYREVQNIIEARGWVLISEEYKDCNEKLAIVCDNGHPIYKTLNSVRVGKGCIDCYNLRRGDTLRLTLDDYHAVAAHQGFNFIDVLPKNNEENVLWQCRYNHIWKASFHNVGGVNETGCPRCYEKDRQSKNERKLCNWLASLSKDICSNYEHPKKFADLVDKKQLSYDAFGHFVGDAMRVAFETDGKQHYEPCEFFGGQKTFETQRCHDILKEEYCIRNKIHLIRVKYDEVFDTAIIREFERAVEAHCKGELYVHRIIM